MELSRRAVITLALAAVGAVTIAILQGLIGTVFFAVTVAYLLTPLGAWLRRRGLPAWWSAAAATGVSVLVAVAVFVPIGVVLYIRRRAALALLRSLPDSFTIAFDEFTYVVVVEDLTSFLARRLTQLAVSIAEGMPVIAVKAMVFAFVVFALLYRGERVRAAIEGAVPGEYHDDLVRLHERIRQTLYSIYVIQAATALATFVIALVVFLALGIQFPLTLAVLAGLFQFLPVIGPSLIIAGLVIGDLARGDLVGAAVIGAVGIVFIGILPDAVLRPWLANETAMLPSALYFVGLTGGLLSLGPVGIVAGPLVVVLLLELLSMLSEARRIEA